MNVPFTNLRAGLQCSLVAGSLLISSTNAIAVDFEKEIEPAFKMHCWDCHGPDEQESQLRLDRLANLLSGGNSGEPAVVPGKPDASYLLKLIRHEEPGTAMPPDGKLSKEQIASIEQWIRDGAKTPVRYGPAKAKADLSHWAFQPIRETPSSGIDEFIRKKLASSSLQMSPQAEKRILIRRLYLVMLGLPPSPERVERFINDTSKSAWTNLVDEVLASPHYGERWATFWLDLVRFGETHGFETNRERPHAWRYRDWVIHSLNEDKPFDQFVKEQIAGDALNAPVATGFLVAGPYDLVKGQDPKLGLMQRMNELDDMINTTGTAFLGLTTGCARCHSHKFDPISQRDYYAMQAVFAGVRHGDRQLPPTPDTLKELKAIDQQIAELTEKLKPFKRTEAPAAIVLDESRAKHFVKPRGTAKHAAVPANTFGNQHYTWWTNEPGKVFASYQPQVRGDYRVWLSWGSGFHTHCKDARYVIRSASGDEEIAQVNQRLPANGKGQVDQVPRWSDFYDAGIHTLAPDDEILIIGGDEGTAMTADVVVLQPVSNLEKATASLPQLRQPVRPTINSEEFPVREALFVRFTIHKSNQSQACIDELEIFSNGNNVALASAGAKATSSGDFVHPKHKLEHINDGLYGNPHSWITSKPTGGWVQIEFPEPKEIDRIVWARDREGQFADRLAIDYRIETALKEGQWEIVATSDDRLTPGKTTSANDVYDFRRHDNKRAEQGKHWLKQLTSARQQKEQLSKSETAYAGTFSQPGPTHRLYRGEPDAKREQVTPGSIDAFASLNLKTDSPEQKRRLAFANWIASKENPLTARVIVNRIWQFHFGTGIVDTPSDFGRNGAIPTHPELLDWLAKDLITHNWSLKHIHRRILMSETWQQSNRPNSNAMKIDATSRLLWRFPQRRMEAEAIRDSILSVTGVLDLQKSGGPGFSPFEVELENVRHYHAKTTFGPEDFRRMVYMTKVRQEREHVFGAFDCPDSSMAVPKRSRSTTPLQALNLLNSQFIMQQADLFATRLSKESNSRNDQIRRAWQLCYQRNPTQEETADSHTFIETHGLTQFSRALLNTNEFVFIP